MYSVAFSCCTIPFLIWATTIRQLGGLSALPWPRWPRQRVADAGALGTQRGRSFSHLDINLSGCQLLSLGSRHKRYAYGGCLKMTPTFPWIPMVYGWSHHFSGWKQWPKKDTQWIGIRGLEELGWSKLSSMDVNKTWPMAPFCCWWLSHTPEKSEMFMAKNGSMPNHPPVFQDGPNIAKQQKSTQNPCLVCSHSYLKYIYICSGSHLSAMLS